MGWDFPWALSPESVVFLPEGNRVCNNPTGDILQKVIMEFLQKACSRERTVTTSLFSECVRQQAKQKQRIITVIDCKMATESLRVWMCSALLWDRLLFSILWNWVGHLTYTSSRHLKAPVSRACSLAVPGILGLPHEGAQAGPWEPSGGEARHPTDSQLAAGNTSETIPSPETSLAHSCPLMHERVQRRSVQKKHPASL